MLSKDFKRYFDSYSKISPLTASFNNWQMHGKLSYAFNRPFRSLQAASLRCFGIKKLNKAVSSTFLAVSQGAADSVGVYCPHIFLDKRLAERHDDFAVANRPLHAIFYNPSTCGTFTKKELTALAHHELKHLYQATPITSEECHANEYDSDRAALRATDYKTMVNLFAKVTTYLGQRHLGTPEQGALRIVRENAYDLMSQKTLETFDVVETFTHPATVSKSSARALPSRHANPISRDGAGGAK